MTTLGSRIFQKKTMNRHRRFVTQVSCSSNLLVRYFASLIEYGFLSVCIYY